MGNIKTPHFEGSKVGEKWRVFELLGYVSPLSLGAPPLLCWGGRKGLIDVLWQQQNEWNQLIDSLAEEWVHVDVGSDPKKRVSAWAKISWVLVHAY